MPQPSINALNAFKVTVFSIECLSYILSNKMSQLRKLRDFRNPESRKKLGVSFDNNSRKSILRASKLQGSRLLQQIRCHTEEPSPQQQKDVLYHKNITHFRDSFFASDSFALPFLSSLRKIKDYRQEKALGLTSLQPFDVSSKLTVNQKTKKEVNDMRANPFRLSKINYRWHNGSGLGIKNSCEFECTLRLDKNTRNPQQSAFYNTIEPIRYRTVEERRYELKDIICSRQKRLFTLQQH